MRIHGNRFNKISFDLRHHFIEKMGWDRRSVEFTMHSEELGFEDKIVCIAHKRGMCAYVSREPDITTQREIKKHIDKLTYENMVLFACEDHWKWYYKNKCYTVPTYYVPPIEFDLCEEENLTIVDAVLRTEKSFSTDTGFLRIDQ